MKPRHVLPAILLAALIAYPLSLGPFARYRYREFVRLSQITLQFDANEFPLKTPSFFAPLFWLRQRSKPIDHAMTWHESFWLDSLESARN
jgi:hypothetical protein